MIKIGKINKHIVFVFVAASVLPAKSAHRKTNTRKKYVNNIPS